jgi:hypothetical protein
LGCHPEGKPPVAGSVKATPGLLPRPGFYTTTWDTSQTPELPVGAVRIRAYAQGANRRSGASQTTFRPTDGICFRLASDQVQGGHQFLVVLHGPSGWTVRSPALFGLGPIDRPGPIEPLWICTPLPGAPAGGRTAAVETEGLERGGTTFTVKPCAWSGQQAG